MYGHVSERLGAPVRLRKQVTIPNILVKANLFFFRKSGLRKNSLQGGIRGEESQCLGFVGFTLPLNFGPPIYRVSDRRVELSGSKGFRGLRFRGLGLPEPRKYVI